VYEVLGARRDNGKNKSNTNTNAKINTNTNTKINTKINTNYPALAELGRGTLS
jgi:hypothetical protein